MTLDTLLAPTHTLGRSIFLNDSRKLKNKREEKEEEEDEVGVGGERENR